MKRSSQSSSLSQTKRIKNLFPLTETESKLVKMGVPISTHITLRKILKDEIIETQFVYTDVNLMKLVYEIKRRKCELDMTIYNMLVNNQFEQFDTYIAENSGKENFWRILQQLFMSRYFLGPMQQITRKQLQNALGIQQMRWCYDPESDHPFVYDPEEYYFSHFGPYDRGFHHGKLTEMVLFQNIKEEYQQRIINVFRFCLVQKMGSETATENFDFTTFLQNSIWYKIRGCGLGHLGSPADSAMDLQFRVKENDKIVLYTWIPIPESLNMSKITCIYAPQLTFGSLTTRTLYEYIKKNGCRPYHAILPESNRNVKELHERTIPIFVNWLHDFHHSTYSDCERHPELYHNPSYHLIEDPYEEWTDNGYVFPHHDTFPIFEGGKKTRSRTRRRRRHRYR